MIGSRLFQKHFALAVGTLLLFLILGFVFTDYLMKSMMPHREMVPPVFMAKLLDRINSKDRAAALQELSDLQGSEFKGPNLILLNEQGQILYPHNLNLDLDWEHLAKPTEVYGYTRIKMEKEQTPPLKIPHLLMPKGGPHPPGMRDEMALIRLPGEPLQYLLMMPPPHGPPPGEKPSKFFPFVGLISLIGSLLLGVGVAISLIYHSVNKNVKLADHVLSELQNGNLKARFPVHRKDEFGQAMIRFNRMADEIEKLVEHLRFVEQARTKLLQELAHDLRTPIASLKSLLETLDLKRDRLEVKVQQELMTLSLREVDYFERLVEDLLFLAQVTEPRYQTKHETVSLDDLISEEAENCAVRYSHEGKKVEIEKTLAEGSFQVSGDLILLRRLLRNALENAFSFAQSKVTIHLQKADPKNPQQIQVQIDDDGPGFSEQGLKSFGERRLSRKIESNQNSRVSVGLGSVVMKTICNIHRGQLQASNRLNASGELTGARVQIQLPGLNS